MQNLFLPHAGTNGVAVANSIGASSLAILLSLGVPWLFKAAILAADEYSEKSYVFLRTNGVEFTVLSLIPMILIVYFIFWIRKFNLTKRTGVILFLFYLLFITFAVLVEVNILFKPKFCD